MGYVERENMGWWGFFIISSALTLILVPVEVWKKYYLAGIMGMVIILPIDYCLTSLAAFQFIYEGVKVLGLPIPYWISYLPGGILYAYFYPEDWKLAPLYIIFASAVFTLVEFFTIAAGLFEYLNWNLFNAFVLDVFGFTVLTWFIDWFYYDRYK